MNIMLITALMFASMILLLLTGRQIFIIIGGVGTIIALSLWGPGAEQMPFLGGYMFMNWYVVVALPQFVLMGITLSRSGVADGLFQAFYLWMGRIRGGLGMATVGLCALVAAMSGVNVAATVTAGTIALPAMLKRKYNKLMVTGLVQAGGALGFLIPPSIVFILYGIIAKVSIGHLWMAGILPGILLASLYIVYIGVRCHLQPHLGPPVPEEERVGWGEKFRALRSGLPAIGLILAVLGLIFMGITTLVESASIGATGAIMIAASNKRLNWKILTNILDETIQVSCMFLWIFAAALLFSAVFDGLGAVHAVENMIGLVAGDNRWGILIIMQLSFFLMGMVLDDTAMLLIVAPLYIPLVAKMGFSLVWYGVLYVLNCQMAFITPPFGYNLFIMKGIAPKEITMADIYRSVIPFVGIQAAALAIVMAFPQIALWLPSLVFGGQ